MTRFSVACDTPVPKMPAMTLSSSGRRLAMLFSQLTPAVRNSLIFRITQTLVGFLTIPVIVRYLNAAEQGYYYMFLGLIALQSFLELGFGIVITIFAAHEWHHLQLDRKQGIVGQPEARSRLASLGRIIVLYFSISAALFMLLGLAVGFFTLSPGHAPLDVARYRQLAAYVALASAVFWFNPLLNIIEGCNQVSETAKFRTAQIVVAYGAMWAALASGAGLWAPAILAGCQFCLLAVYLLLWQRPFIDLFRHRPQGGRIAWLQDVFPMQWRIGVQGLFGYFSFPFYTTLTFWVLGSVIAGKVGLTLQIASGIQSLGLVAISARSAEFGLLAASGQRAELARRCKSATALGGLVVLAGFATLLVGQYVAIGYWPRFSDRVLGEPATIMLAVGVLATIPVQGAALFLRANKVERLTPVGVASGILYGIAGAIAIHQWGQIGLVASYAIVTTLFTLPLTLMIARKYQ